MKLRILIAILVSANASLADDQERPDKWKNWDLEIFSSEAPPRSIDLFRGLVGDHPPTSVKEEAARRLAYNSELRNWLPAYFAENPVILENYSERSRVLYVVQQIPAEWAVRFFLELSQDVRPMTSEEVDFDAVFDDLKERARNGHDVSYEILRYKLDPNSGKPMGSNDWLARQKVSSMGLSIPTLQERGDIPTDVWLRLPAQRNRIPEIVRETWGATAILNADIGLGPDNMPLSESRAPEAPKRLPPPSGNGEAEVVEESVGNSGSSLPLAIALIVLVVAVVVVVWSKLRSDG
jgi:hypothetical protein